MGECAHIKYPLNDFSAKGILDAKIEMGGMIQRAVRGESPSVLGFRAGSCGFVSVVVAVARLQEQPREVCQDTS
jgi:hypothetical protein